MQSRKNEQQSYLHEIAAQSWSFSGPFGTFDRAQLQRGFQVYQEVCAGCHGLKYIAFRNLSDLGYNEDQIKAFASQATIVDGPDDDGEMFERVQVGLRASVDPWLFIGRGRHREKVDDDGTRYGQMTDEFSQRGILHEWRRRMLAEDPEER